MGEIQRNPYGIPCTFWSRGHPIPQRPPYGQERHLHSLGQCIMKKRPRQKVEAGLGAASAALLWRGLRSATAAFGE
jgi:hypothetical protein